MKLMKTLLKLVGAFVVTAGTVASVVACTNNDNDNDLSLLNDEFCKLLGWYNIDGTSKIEQTLVYYDWDHEPGKKNMKFPLI